MKNVSSALLSFLITVGLYVLFFWIISMTPGDESTSGIWGLAVFVAMTVFINFPISWFVVYLVTKRVHGKSTKSSRTQ